jgi:hypothetical protein
MMVLCSPLFDVTLGSGKKLKRQSYGKMEDTEDFLSIDPYKMEMVPEEDM